MGPRFVRLAAVFYGLLVLAAAVFGALGDRNIFEPGDSPILALASARRQPALPSWLASSLTGSCR